MNDVPPHLTIHPPLERHEVAFLAGFAADGGLRRLWPGQPSPRSPWRPSPGGRRLDLDPVRAVAAPHDVAPWLRFLSRTFLAPSSAAALEAALDAGLRGGHRLAGRVEVDGHLRVVVERNRVTEHLLPDPEVSLAASGAAAVVDLDACRIRSRTCRPRRSAPRSRPS
ncbi:hypothetical protein FE634_15795 [Nocardioides dongxiaopingii]|uniref:hypothetical protein n=1 Tax=Nocardioides sp. S-1144 TaxID=2582905 RepID=UPI00110F586A|nr:hypothetical protein [Nocardioides sp. S-1144]QCW51509.1 hypothetical protein FE634_15795 [Nocardioides sp. S-1144]